MKKLFQIIGLCIAIFVSVSLNGCATADFRKNLTAQDRVFGSIDALKIIKDRDLEAASKEVGKEFTGFVPPETSEARLIFERDYPATSFSGDVKQIFDSTYLDRVGQSVAWGIDLEKRTSGFLKDNENRQISVTGRFKLDVAGVVNDAAIMSGATNMVSAAATGFQVAPTMNAAIGGLGVGLVGGLIVGAINASSAEQTVNGFLKSGSFGERMGHTTGSSSTKVYVPYFHPVDEYLLSHFFVNDVVEPVVVLPGIVRFVFAREGSDNIDYSKDVYFASTVGIYRGKKYEEVFPKTKGWEFRVTNLNLVRIPAVPSWGNRNMEDHIRFYTNLRGAIRSAKIVL
jgi:hypothetical protein